jgi:hypothetical protein
LQASVLLMIQFEMHLLSQNPITLQALMKLLANG